MQFHEIINAKYSKEPDRPMMQKDAFPVNDAFVKYLRFYGRDVELPILYSDLANYSYADSLKDKRGKWTHWENAVYEPGQLKLIKAALIKTYAILKNYTNPGAETQFEIERIDFCEYGNSIPFRIKVIDIKNAGQYDFFYIKPADASRIYGLELEHLLTRHPINFLCHQNTLVEENIEGIPGDVFLQQNPPLTAAEKAGIAGAFVQFNAGCFARLLGDMRSYNFVVNHFYSNGNPQYHIRAIDFDQQSYEGRRNYYFPQYFKENVAYVELVIQNLSAMEIEQYQQMEYASMASKSISSRRQLLELVNCMIKDDISENYKIQMLRNELNDYFGTTRFSACKTMGAIVKQQLKQVLQRHINRKKVV